MIRQMIYINLITPVAWMGLFGFLTIYYTALIIYYFK